VAIGHEDEKEVILATMRAGARDFLRVEAGREETEAAVERLLRTSPAPTQGGGEQTAILCSRPDVATSCFAVHLALRLLEDVEGDDKVLLVDLGVPAADSLLYLDVEPSYTFVDAVRSVRRFDQTLIETAFSRDRSGLAVLPLLDDPNQVRDVNASDMLALFSILKGYFTHTVVNLGGLRSPGFLAQVLSQADRTLLLADQSVANCSAARRLLDDLEEARFPTRDIEIVLERYTEKLDPRADKIAEVLGLSVAATLPPAGFEMVRAMNSAMTVYECDPDSPYAKAMRALADDIAGVEPEPPKGFAASRLAQRLRGLKDRS
jgi:pilus assembly protein CpaE